MSNNPRSVRQAFRVTLVGDEKHDVETRYSDLLTVERTLIASGLSADPKANPVHYATCLIWAAMVRMQLTAFKWREFPDMLIDYESIGEEPEAGPGLDPTRQAAQHVPALASPGTSEAGRPTG